MSMASRWAKYLQPLLELLGAGRRGIGAAVVDLVRVADHRGAAARAVGGEDERHFRAVARVVLDADDLGDDLAGLLDHHRVADPDVLAGDLVGVVQRGPLDRRAGQADRLEVGHGVSLPVLPTWTPMCAIFVIACSASYLKAIVHRGLLLARPQPLALAEVVDLDHQAVGLEVERVPLVLPLLGVLDHLLDRVVALRVRADRDAPALQLPGDLVVRALVDALGLSQPVRDEPEPPLAADLRSRAA